MVQVQDDTNLHGLADPSRNGSTVPSNWQPVTDKVTLAVLGKMIEEASELANIAARCIIQGVDGCNPKTGKPNADALMEEVADVLAAATHVKNMLGREIDRNRVTAKYAHKAQWHDMLRENK